MANAIRCDRCCAYVDRRAQQVALTDSVSVSINEKNRTWREDRDAFDLCPECASDLADFLGDPKMVPQLPRGEG